MKNAKNILLDYAWEIHALGDTMGGPNINVAIDAFCNNLDDVSKKDDQYKYDGITLDWAAIAAEYGWSNLSDTEKAEIKRKHEDANDTNTGEIGKAFADGNKARLHELYEAAYKKIG